VALAQLSACLLVAAGASCGRIAFDPSSGGGGGGDGAVVGDAVPSGTPGGVSSGTRLRVMLLDGDEGSVVPDNRFGLYDTVLAAPCEFEQLPDSTWACVPRDLAVGANDFADSACTVPAATTPSSSRGCYTRYAVDAADHVYAVGAGLSQIYRVVSGSCTVDSLAFGYFAVGAEIPEGSLVSATVEVVAFGRLSYRQWVAADGARQLFDTVVDTSLGADCTIEPDIGQPDPVCGPTTVYQTMYSDSGCTAPIYGPVSGTPPATFAVDDDGTGFAPPCAPRTYHLTGTTVIPSSVYLEGATGCMLLGSTGATYITDGGSVARTAYASGVFERAATQRLAATSWLGTDGMMKPLAREPLYDRQLATRCVATADSAGSLRCVPTPDMQDDLFADASCSSISYYYVSCGSDAIYEQEPVVATSCLGTFGQRVRTPAPAAHAYVQQQSACVDVAQGSMTLAVDQTASGTISAPATFVALTPTTE
jgi:hypothetical protein